MNTQPRTPPSQGKARRARDHAGQATRRKATGGVHGADTPTAMSDRIRKAAIDLFKVYGYHGTSMRDLAQVVGIEPAGLYYHFASKQEILLDLFQRIMDALLKGGETVIEGDLSPEQKLRAFVRSHVLVHIARQEETFISHMELRSLSETNRQSIVAQRDHYETRLRELLTAGLGEGAFNIPDVRLTSTAILMMCSGVADWFTAGGRLTAEGVADYYADMAIRMVTA